MMLLKVLALVSVALAQNYDADVLILGAGTAGLAAARVLTDKNVSFLIIEGADTIGGRIRSTQFGGITVELGSAALYGTNESINEFVNEYNLTGSYVDYESVVVRTSEATPVAGSDAAWDKLAAAQVKVKELYRKIKEGKMRDMSIRTALEYGNWFPKDAIDDVIEIYDYDYEFSKIPELMSTQGFESVSEYQEAPYMSTDSRGLEGIFKAHAREVLAESDPRLKLNEVVEKISHTGSSVSVTTKSGKTFTGKYAIVTFSIGVLKSKDVAFEPVLPEWKMDTIYRTSMDVFTQVYVKFNNKFWENDQFILHANPKRGYYPVIWNMVANGFHPAEKNMLSFDIMGEEARRVERASKTRVLSEITDVLRGMYNNVSITPTDILVTKWLDDPLARGSFSSRQVGDGNPRFMDALTSPVGRVYFAGEAYHDVLDGFAAGAMMSGNSTAMNLYDCMMTMKCHKFDPNPVPNPTPKPPTCGTAFIYLSSLLILATPFMCLFS